MDLTSIGAASYAIVALSVLSALAYLVYIFTTRASAIKDVEFLRAAIVMEKAAKAAAEQQVSLLRSQLYARPIDPNVPLDPHAIGRLLSGEGAGAAEASSPTTDA